MAADATDVSWEIATHLEIARGARLRITGFDQMFWRQYIDRLTMPNPRFDEAARLGYSTCGIHRELRFWSEADDGALLLPREVDVLTLWRASGRTATVHDETTAPSADLRVGATLRPYQQRAVDALAHHDAGQLIAPTGSGKTVMACALAARKGCRTLIIVHTSAFRRQWIDAVRRLLGVRAGEIGGGRWEEGPAVTVATVQTLARRGCDGLGEYGTVIVDEAHHAPALSWARVLDRLPARSRFALTATPWRGDGLQKILRAYFGENCAQISRAEVEGAGGIVPATVRPIFTNSLPRAQTWLEMIDGLVNDRDRNRQIMISAWVAARQGPTLVLTNRIAHAKALGRAISTAAYPTVVLHGELPTTERDAAFRKIRDGSARITVATMGILGEGVDVPGWENLILALPRGSRGPGVIQAVGRLVRPAPGKDRAHAWDLVDRHHLARSAWRGRKRLCQRHGIVVERHPPVPFYVP